MDAPAPSASARAAARWALIRNDLFALIRLAGPVIASRLGVMTMGLTDAIVVGRYSALQLGFHALAWGASSIVLTVALGLLSGVQVMAARAVGEGRPAAAGAVLRRGMVYAAQVGLGASVLLAAVGPLLLHSLGLPRDLADGATGPLIVFSLSLAPYAVSVAAGGWLEAMSRPGAAMLMMWLANAVNLAIDLVLVPGRFGAPALGAVGAACATLGSRVVLLALILIYIARMPEAKALGVFEKPPREPAAEAEQRRVGFGAGASNFCETTAFAAMTVVAGWQGGLAVAAWSVVLNVTALVFMVPLGLSTAATVLVGSAYGARDLRGVNRAAAVSFAVTMAFGIAIAVVVWPLRTAIAATYTTNAEVIALAGPAFGYACFYFQADGLQVVGAQVLRARGDVWLPSVSHLVSYLVVMTPLAWLLALPLRMGLNGQVLAVVIASVLSAALLLGRFAQLGLRERV